MSADYCALCECSESFCDCSGGFRSGLQQEVDELNAEVTRLRQALAEIRVIAAERAPMGQKALDAGGRKP